MKRRFLLMILMTLFLAAGTIAQTNVGDTIEKAKDKFSDIKNRSNELDRMRREADASPPKTANKEIRFPEVKEDFEQIQLINGNELQPDAASSNPDFNAIYKAASEIKKRAERLRSNLFVLDAKKKSKKKSGNNNKEIQPFDLKVKASELDTSIADFVKNPMFKNIQVVNPEDSQLAQVQLEKIIKLSAIIEGETAKTENK